MLLRATTLLAASARFVRHASAGVTMCNGVSAGISISDSFDSGNIQLAARSHSTSEDQCTVSLQIKPDPYTELEEKAHMQWFAFRATPIESLHSSKSVTYEIVNAGDASFSGAWSGYEVVASHDRRTWHRVASTAYDEGRGTLKCGWTHEPGAPPVTFAYFDIFSYERHLDLVARSAVGGARVASLGRTLDGRELECITVGSGALHAWIIHRQHPGESMAEFFAEGLLSRLLGLGTSGAVVDALATTLRERFTFHIVPSMNPDGAARGHLRVNAGGANLNREWAPTGGYDAPTLARSPEVYHVLRAMDATGCDFFVDVHGDEELPYAFCAGGQGLDVWGRRMEALHGAFVGSYSRANTDMQARYGYEPDPPKGGNLAICSNQISQRFDCLGVTLEMPFKDSAAVGRPRGTTRGFDGERAARLGASLLDALAYVAPSLRGEPEPKFLAAGDEYVVPTEDYKGSVCSQ
jgi:murein tripeptide amidase MpaA